jgi:hypothetical protein
MTQQILRQRTAFNLDLSAFEAIHAAQVAREYDRARGPFAFVESFRRAMTQSFGPASFLNDLVAASQAHANLATLHGLSESARIATSLQDSFARHTFTSPFEFSTALRQQLDALSVPRWAYTDFAGSLGIDKSTFALAVESATQAASSRVRAPRASGLPRAAAKELVSALENEANVEDVFIEVATALRNAAARQPKQVDWKFLLPLIIGVLMFLLDWQRAGETEGVVLEVVEEVRAKHNSVVSGLAALTRALGRPATSAHDTWLFAQPRANAARAAAVAKGTSLLILQRHGRWSLVVVLAQDAASSRMGWMRHKYLRYARP